MPIPQKVLKIGDKGRDVMNLHKYLKKYGYMKTKEVEVLEFGISSTAANEPKDEDIFDKNTKNALTKFQKFYKLRPSGKLDAKTLDLISKPRCGVHRILAVILKSKILHCLFVFERLKS